MEIFEFLATLAASPVFLPLSALFVHVILLLHDVNVPSASLCLVKLQLAAAFASRRDSFCIFFVNKNLFLFYMRKIPRPPKRRGFPARILDLLRTGQEDVAPGGGVIFKLVADTQV